MLVLQSSFTTMVRIVMLRTNLIYLEDPSLLLLAISKNDL